MTSSTTPDPAELAQTIDDVSEMEGWMRDDQARSLWAAGASVTPGGQIVEIGSYHGKSTIVLARSSAPTVKVVAIDPHAGNDRGPGEWEGEAADGQADHEQFLKNLAGAGVAERVSHVREFSDNAHPQVEGDIDVLYVDGAHGYQPALSDISGWGARVKPGGTMLIHDVYNSVFVSLAVMRALYFSDEWTYAGRAQSMAIYTKERPSRVANAAKQAANLPWFARNVILKGMRASGLEDAGKLLGHEPGSGFY